MTEAGGQQRLTAAQLCAAAVVAVVGLTLVLTIGVHKPPSPEQQAELVAAAHRPQPNAKVPGPGVPAPVDRLHASDAAELRAWSLRVGVQTGVPARAVEGYGLAEMWMRSEAPACRLSWTTLAGIGQVATGHGSRDGGSIGPDGVSTKAIVTEDGRRGPLLVRSAQWREHRYRASRDGEKPDPQQVDDAAVTVARQLCAQAKDLTQPARWWSAVRAHGGSTRFAQDVFTAADGLRETVARPGD